MSTNKKSEGGRGKRGHSEGNDGLPSVRQLDRRSLLLGALASGAPFAFQTRASAAPQPSTLVGILEEDPPVMNPAITAVISSYASGCPVYSALTDIRPDGSITPGLAEKWEISSDGLTYTFHLRKDVSWHDDAPFSSADVKFSIENANAKLHPWGRGAYKALDRIETPDAHTVTFHL